ncbi:sirohydrochlorin ferrochelatase [Saccharopolyspora erythraea NRRL 2338]|uniref:Cobalamin (Vitamin B12) biosynthesis CbiX protein n=2 Tax=Saccharopolyspora erythraea TaxID=1836 RepID=A4F9R9_SACEN|nr:sirohydrochlorin chelatase [Saccharopolyspora erythraea]PFG94581.1 sirohydrochlorin ferrochelatase [Saccharopolyspora erythraea NRRL 2338]QRK91322.1 sirohydrochlorin chelatase [Saccharopolyspora erythraea]CAM00794.1 cobalamin (vitamin B12) biosynthesis CbiX protein [Saccharopolyspora erythraea NRRL 2338]
MNAPLVAVAHGSRDPRSAATIHALMDVVRAMRPDLDVRTAFLDLSAPRLGDVLGAVHGDGHREAVVVPLLLGRAFHARVDVPAAVADVQQRLPRFRVHTSDVLGPDSRLDEAAWERLAQTGVRADDPELGVVLAGAGSSHDPANRLVADVAARWQARTSWAGAVAAFAAAADPDVPAAVADLRARGARRFAVASWFLAPGLLPDRIIRLAREHTGEPVLAEPMADHPGVAELVLQRYADALAAASHPAEYPRAQ